MKNIILLLLIFVSLISTPCFATDFYVNQTSGNDGNDGSIGSPWKTVDKVNNSSFSCGDNVYFNRNDTWSETLIPPSSGCEGNHITFGAYGTGAKPIIQGDTVENNSLLVSAKGNLVFDGLHIKGTNATADHTTSRATLVSGCTGKIHFKNNKFTYDVNQQNENVTFLNCDGFLFENNEIDDGMYGLAIRGDDTGNYAGTVRWNTIHDQNNGTFEEWDNIKIGNTDGGTFTGLLIYENELYGFNEDGIDMIAGGGEIFLIGNHIHSPGAKYTSSPNVQGIKLPSDSFLTNGITHVYGNRIHGIQHYDGTNGICINSGLGNVAHLWNNLCYDIAPSGVGFRIPKYAAGSTVYNNTIYSETSCTGMRIRENAVLTLKNNIVGCGTTDITIDGSSSVVTGDYNISINDSSVGTSNGGTYNAGGNDLFETDPLLNANYSIPTNSPAKDAGETLPEVTHDIRGYPRPGGAGYDIGAFEFGSLMKFQGVTLQ